MPKFPNSWTGTGISPGGEAPENRPALSGMTRGELETALAALPGSPPSYRAAQIISWIARGALSFDDMTNLPRSLRSALAERFTLRGSAAAARQEDRDGTVKLGIRLRSGAVVETVLLAAAEDTAAGAEETEKRRYTACLSTQAGCPVGCVFCKTGSLGFLRNLDASEIVDQFLYLSDLIRPSGGRISRVVVMGMGEPLLNLAALRGALEILRDGEGAALSKRGITVSTAGIRRGILDMAENGPEAELALSLTTAREDLRLRLMPGTAGNSLGEVKKALKIYREKQGRQITLETVLLGEINTTAEDARALAGFARGLPALVNIIPWNPVEGLSFEGKPLRKPAAEETAAFKKMLTEAGLTVTQRYRRGRGVSGACGQLGSALPL
ncbi:MAG: 23S rRNA (adenine(2503)-C(2))-methyltransferase RlmN [Treponema sp.]|jgi:23S rRNA (adenine2503-C2)-methyltransferase|nr:23S rRNA (adenine(2503)-C(2))-methyltransferase RlmN [Treponema sp.]